MDESDCGQNVVHLGYAVICDHCSARIRLPSASTVEEAKEDAKRKGVIFKGSSEYCSLRCSQSAT